MICRDVLVEYAPLHTVESVRNGYLTYRRSVRDLSNGCGQMYVKAMFILYWLAFRAATKKLSGLG